MARGNIRIGISGWRYKPWRGVFYPEELRHKDELAFAARAFRTIEINGTFYSLQRPSSFVEWCAATPDDFVFAVKGPRFITHIKQLNDVKRPLANFWASGVLRLESKLGPILWQFSPRFRFNAEKIEAFFRLLPADTATASKIARGHDSRIKGRTSFVVDGTRPMRHAVEIRHDSFCDPAFVALLRKYQVGLVVADTVEWPLVMDVTADFVYCRLHGSEVLYTSGYDNRAIRTWARRIAAWADGSEPRDAQTILEGRPLKRVARDVFVYFDNDVKVRAPIDAQSLERLMRNARTSRPKHR